MIKQPSLSNEIEIFSLKPTFERLDGVLIDVVVYVFGGDGELIVRQPVQKGKARLALTEEECREARIVLGPPVDDLLGVSFTLDDIRQCYVYEPEWHYKPWKKHYTLSPVPESIWREWLLQSLWHIPRSMSKCGSFIIF